MNKALTRILAGVVPALAVALAAEARTALDFFIEMPPEVYGMLTETARRDMIDYHNAGLDTPTDNVFGGKSLIVYADSLRVDISGSSAAADSTSSGFRSPSTLTLAVAPDRGDTILTVIETVSTPTPDSRVSFFTPGWKPLDIAQPTLADFITPEGHKAGLSIADFPEMTFTSVEIACEGGAEPVLVFKDRTVAHYSTVGDSTSAYAALKFFKPEIRRTLRGRKLVATDW